MEVSRLSRSAALTRLAEIRTEIRSFLKVINVYPTEVLKDVSLLCQFSYLADIFGKINELSLQLQGKIKIVFDESHKYVH